ncbi:type II secretion system F family protein [Kitasatospora sp. NPDC058218]|uniref:type II secretion system F family protein n=1 Tax=Kitasatospora sp. NPDC058218 TaxID=3346385 RepID=UPI0036DA7417
MPVGRLVGRWRWALPGAGSTAPGAAAAGQVRRAVLAAGAGAGAAVLLGGGTGVVAGAMLAVGLYRRLSRSQSPVARRLAWEEEQLARQLPFTAELLAACLGSAASPAAAVAAVGRSVGAPMGPRLVTIAAELALGAPPEVCWSRLGEEHPSLAPLARCLVRTSLSGAPAAGPLIGLAQGCRSAAARAAHARVRRAGVLATAPLGLCFLPAFVLISVVPVVMGLTAGFARSI